ncbi:MAG: tetratricopeptide repeat protein [Undibacterium sp.]|nr:tetratricopeptide repeat protein [Opitutaceae bacterium]
MAPSSPSFIRGILPRWSPALLVAAVVIAYANTFSVPFLFDDVLAIVENPTIRHLWPLTTSLSPPAGQGLTVEGRPLLNFSFALNYAVSGTAPWSYHLANIALHALAALTLFSLIRRTLAALSTPRVESPTTLAFYAALLWAVHPLQTESVTYIVQRAESLMGLLYLLTLYCFARGALPPPRPTLALVEGRPSENRPPRSAAWQTLAVLACALGMATKEVMVTAPLLTLLYDRTFVSGSFRTALRRHARCYAALAATWLLLAALVLGSGSRGGTIGGASGVAWWEFALTQSRAVLHYVRLAVWPSPLIFDYGPDFVSLATAAPYLLLDLALLTLTGLALWRRPALGFLGAWFFLILAPTSSVVGGTRQMLVEHRLYLPLAALTVGATLGAHRYLGRRTWIAALAAAVALGTATVYRNADYASELTLYRDTVVKRPANGFARYNLGKVYADAGRHAEAIAEFTESARLIPAAAPTPFNLANSLVALGRTAEARASYEAALRLDPRYVKAHFNLGNLLLAAGDKSAALDRFQTAVALAPGDLTARTNLGGVLLELGRLDEARAQLEHVARDQPDSVEVHFGLGNIALLQARPADPAREFETVLRLRPDLAVARERLELARARR